MWRFCIWTSPSEAQLLASLCYATLCAEHERSCWNTEGVLLPNHKGFHKNSDQNISFNFSLLIPGNPVLIKTGATKKLSKVFKKIL